MQKITMDITKTFKWSDFCLVPKIHACPKERVVTNKLGLNGSHWTCNVCKSDTVFYLSRNVFHFLVWSLFNTHLTRVKFILYLFAQPEFKSHDHRVWWWLAPTIAVTTLHYQTMTSFWSCDHFCSITHPVTQHTSQKPLWSYGSFCSTQPFIHKLNHLNFHQWPSSGFEEFWKFYWS